MTRAVQTSVSRDLRFELASGLHLEAELMTPAEARALVIFAHGSGSNRHSPRNRFVASRLHAAGFATLLLDLTHPGEAASVDELGRRLLAATRAVEQDADVGELPIFYYGASTGAAVALLAAAARPESLRGVVSRGGRPDLVPAEVLARVAAPTLFLVGSLDVDVLGLNRRAARAMTCDREIDVIAGAGHLFEEPGTLERLADRVVTFLRSRSFDTRVHRAKRHRARGSHHELQDGAGDAHETTAHGRRFKDRADAGAKLASALEHHRGSGALVLGLPRGGVPVAYQVATHLELPLDIIVARKLGAPGQEELALGAVTADGTVYRNEELIRQLGVQDAYLSRVIAEQSAEAHRREERFRAGSRPLYLKGRSVILVDDGLATGATMRAALRALRRAKVGHLTVAIPIGARTTCEALAAEVDELVCLDQPLFFHAVGAHYDHFDQTEDDEVERLLAQAQRKSLSAGREPRSRPC